jgi:hypothetical protein
MTMREIQDMTLNVSRGLERLDRRLRERSKRFEQEFRRLRDPHNAIGIRATALPVGDEVRFARVYSKHHVTADLLEPWHRVLYEKDNDRSPLDFSFDLPKNWRPMLRATRAESSHSYQGTDLSCIAYQELHCDGLVELGFVSGGEYPHGEKYLLIQLSLPVTLIANLMTQAHRLRNRSGVPTAEYSIEMRIDIRGHNAKIIRRHYDHDTLGEIAPSSIRFPRYSMGDPAEVLLLLNSFERDFWNSFGKDIDTEEATLVIENWSHQDLGNEE